MNHNIVLFFYLIKKCPFSFYHLSLCVLYCGPVHRGHS